MQASLSTQVFFYFMIHFLLHSTYFMNDKQERMFPEHACFLNLPQEMADV